MNQYRANVDIIIHDGFVMSLRLWFRMQSSFRFRDIYTCTRRQVSTQVANPLSL